jgi:hypothetical protein
MAAFSFSEVPVCGESPSKPVLVSGKFLPLSDGHSDSSRRDLEWMERSTACKLISDILHEECLAQFFQRGFHFDGGSGVA